MAAYTPSDLQGLWILGAILFAQLVVGYLIGRAPPSEAVRPLVWTLLVLATIGVERLVDGEPAGFRMLALIAVVLIGMKAVVVTEERSRGMEPLSLRAWIGFACGWLGMRPRPFTSPAGRSLPGGGGLIGRGLGYAAAVGDPRASPCRMARASVDGLLGGRAPPPSLPPTLPVRGGLAARRDSAMTAGQGRA